MYRTSYVVTCIGACTVQVLLDGVCYVVACLGLLSASLLKLFDVVCYLCAEEVTMTDE